jgi:TolB-like protein/Flp pilus assembly protein TadD
MSSSTPSPSVDTPSGDRLESWKEIAVFLRRDIRTVQRWEKSEAMPVHRHVHDKLGSIYAFKSELADWQRQRTGTEAAAVAEPESAAQPASPVDGPADRPRWWNPLLIAIAVVALVVTVVVIRSQRTELGTAKILVLPFSDLSGDSSQEYFSDGITEELITSLGRQTEGMHVTALGSSLAYKNSPKTARQIGKELKVDYLVTGTVRRSGSRVRVSAHLVRTRDEAHLWDDSYDREITDILALQSDVAAAITDGIRLRLKARPAAPRTVNAQAYDAYLKGRFYWNKRTPDALNQAISYFRQSIADDPNYAPAYVGLADSYLLLGSAQMGVLAPKSAMPQAKEALTKALQLDPSLAEAHASLGHIKLIYDWDWSGAEAEFKRAIELNPAYATAHQWYALYLNAVGRTPEALAQLEIAAGLDPLSPTIQTAIAEAYYFARQYDASVTAGRKALQLNPDFALAYLVLGRAYVQQQKYDDAIAAFDRGWTLSGHAPTMSMFLAHAYAVKGDAARSRKILKDLQTLVAKPGSPYVPSLYIASVYTGMGNADEAFRYLDKAADERCEYLIYLDREPMADPLRKDPRFERLLSTNGLRPPK